MMNTGLAAEVVLRQVSVSATPAAPRSADSRHETPTLEQLLAGPSTTFSTRSALGSGLPRTVSSWFGPTVTRVRAIGAARAGGRTARAPQGIVAHVVGQRLPGQRRARGDGWRVFTHL